MSGPDFRGSLLCPNSFGTFLCTLDKYCTHLMPDPSLKCNNGYTSYSELLGSCHAVGPCCTGLVSVSLRLAIGASVPYLDLVSLRPTVSDLVLVRLGRTLMGRVRDRSADWSRSRRRGSRDQPGCRCRRHVGGG